MGGDGRRHPSQRRLGRAGKGTKGDHKDAYSATIPCKHFAKGTSAQEEKCRFSSKSLGSKTGGTKARSRAMRERERSV